MHENRASDLKMFVNSKSNAKIDKRLVRNYMGNSNFKKTRLEVKNCYFSEVAMPVS
jgi:hypothetical protein